MNIPAKYTISVESAQMSQELVIGFLSELHDIVVSPGILFPLWPGLDESLLNRVHTKPGADQTTHYIT